MKSIQQLSIMGCGISTQNKSSATNGPEGKVFVVIQFSSSGFAVTGQRIHPRPKEEPKKKEEPKLHKIPSEVDFMMILKLN